MSSRPPIPAVISREVLTEPGHGCAVCGASCPLERAHIVPWHKAKEHRTAELICLYANCHAQADVENWGEKTLRGYKQRPRVKRQYEGAEVSPGPRTKLELRIDTELPEFDKKFELWLRHALASFLSISPDEVRILFKKVGSVRVTIELSTESEMDLVEAYADRTDELNTYLSPLVRTELTPKTAEPFESEDAGVLMHVGSLSGEVTEDDLRETFEWFGQATSVNTIKNMFTGESRGFGLVQMSATA